MTHANEFTKMLYGEQKEARNLIVYHVQQYKVTGKAAHLELASFAAGDGVNEGEFLARALRWFA